jgi:hypothetical protein
MKHSEGHDQKKRRSVFAAVFAEEDVMPLKSKYDPAVFHAATDVISATPFQWEPMRAVYDLDEPDDGLGSVRQ